MFRLLGGTLVATLAIACSNKPELQVPGGDTFTLVQGDSVAVLGGQAAKQSDSVAVLGGQGMCTISINQILPDTTTHQYWIVVKC
jgi:hypothetical protein